MGIALSILCFLTKRGIDFGTDWPPHLLGSNGQEWATLPIRWGILQWYWRRLVRVRGSTQPPRSTVAATATATVAATTSRHETRSSMGSTDLGLKEAGVPSFSPRALLHCQHSMMCSFSPLSCYSWPP